MNSISQALCYNLHIFINIIIVQHTDVLIMANIYPYYYFLVVIVGACQTENKCYLLTYLQSYKNKVTNNMWASYKSYYKNKFDLAMWNLSKTCQVLRTAINNSIDSSSLMKEIKSNNVMVTNPSGIANCFDDFFVNIRSTLAAKISSVAANLVII